MAFLDEEEEPFAEPVEGEAAPPAGEAQNRTFIILAVALGGIFVVGLLCIGAYALFIGPRQRVAQQTQVAAVNATNAQIALEMTQAAAPPADTPVPPDTATVAVVVVPTNTPTPFPTSTATATTEPDTPTPSATGPTPTQPPGGTSTPTPLVGGLQATPTRGATPTQLPNTGFADEAGVPGLVLLGLALVAVVIIARRLRFSLR